LEEQLAERDSEIGFLKQHIAARPQADPSVVSMVREVHEAPAFFTPTAKQFTALLNIVLAAHKCLGPRAGDEQAFREHVYAGFAYLATVSRLEPSKFSQFSRGTWLDRCSRWCASRGLAQDGGITPFAAALLMHGDVHHTLNDARFPLDLEVGLIEGSGRLPDGSGWKAVLGGRGLMPATQVVRGRGWSPVEPSPVRIYGGNKQVGEHKGWVEPW
jgi:hypothetical protein